MFCPNCGKPNQEDSRFCEECGTALVENSVLAQALYSEPVSEDSAEAPSNFVLPKFDFLKIKEFSKKNKFILIPVAAVVVLATVFCIIGSSVASPKRIAKNYFESLSKGDYKAMYDCLALPDDEFINEETFNVYMQEYAETSNRFTDVKNYTIEEIKSNSGLGDSYNSELPSAGSNSMIKNFQVSIVDSMTGYIDELKIPLIKQDAKTWLFFDTYKVSAAGYVLQDITINAPANTTVSLDGVELNNKEQSSDEENVCLYEIANLFPGTHTISVVSDMFETYEMEIDINNSESTYNVSANSLKLKEELVSTAKTNATNDFKLLYSKAKDGKEFSTIGIKAAPEADISTVYSRIVEKLTLNSDGTGIKSVTFTSVEANDLYSQYTNDDGAIRISFQQEFQYTYTYTRTQGWFNVTLVDGESSGAQTVRFTYEYVDGEWLLYSLDNAIIYAY